MYTDSVIPLITAVDLYKDIVDDTQRWFDTSDYDESREKTITYRKNKNRFDER